MKKIFILAAIAAASFAIASCNKDGGPSVSVKEASEVSFGIYAPRHVAATRSGAAGVMDNTLLQSEGFGVFAFHTDASAGASAYSSTALPNFMWNQHVTYASSAWSYAPIKYWPNEHGSAASSDQVDKVSFFAYAPYVSASPSGEGIIGLSANSAAGDPKVTYKVAAKPEDNVDLVWGIAPEAISWATANGGTVSIAEGMPYIDLVKPETDGVINFLFKHATAKLGFSIIGLFDEGSKDANTKITVKSVTIKGNFARQGVLNLNNTSAGVARWESKVYDDENVTTLTINSTNNLATALIDAGDVVFASQPAGVTASAQNLLDDDAYFFNLIPGTISEVTIDYFVTTDDASLQKTYSRVENVIRYTFASPLALENNKAYTLQLQLGMTTVKVAATVAAWDGQSPTLIDLPANVD